MRYSVIALVVAVFAITVPIYAQDDLCAPQAVIASFAQAADIGAWAENYSSCPAQTQRAVRQLATGYQLLTSDYLPFAAADNADSFSAIWKWYQGNTSSKVFGLSAGNMLSLIASAMTDQRDGVTTAPVLAYPASGNLTARVRLDFSPLDEASGAGIGIRGDQELDQWIRISREAGRMVVAATQNGTTTEVASEAFASGEGVVYLRIIRTGSQFTLSYSVNDTDWRDVAVNTVLNLPTDVEVFLTIYSPEQLTTVARFSEMQVE